MSDLEKVNSLVQSEGFNNLEYFFLDLHLDCCCAFIVRLCAANLVDCDTGEDG